MNSLKYKIAVDISPLNDGNSVRGVGYYTSQLVAALQDEVKNNPEYQNFSIDLITDSSQLSSGFDLVHYPYFNPFKLTLPWIKKQPTVISIHDVIERQFRQYYPVGIRGKIKWQIQKFLARQADYLITISHYSKYAIADILHYPADRIYVTYLAADKLYHQKYSSQYLHQIKLKYHLPDKFILNNGDVNWNKNIPTLVKACQKLGYPLVIVGKQALDINSLTLQKPSLARPIDLFRYLFHLQSPQLKHITELKELFKSPLVLRLGFVPDDDLPAIFKLATIYCQPSYAEGFALSVVKAMQVGCPVVYSQQTAVAEIMDYNGVMFDPYLQSSLETALKQLWISPALRQKYSRMGLQRSRIFNWRDTALQTLAVYQIALLDAHL